MKWAVFILILLQVRHLAAGECEAEKMLSQFIPEHSKAFKISYYKSFKIVNVENREKYLISFSSKLECKTRLPVLKLEANKIVATSTTHLAFLNFLKLEKKLIGFQGKNYIVNDRYEKKNLKNVSFQLNAEELMAIKADLILAYKSNLPVWKSLRDYHQLGLPLVLIWDYKEPSSLARAEWIILESAFINKEKEANLFFQQMKQEYLKTKNSLARLPRKKVLVGDIQNGRWAACGGKSDLAGMISDAGGELFLKNNSVETQFLSLEKILSNKEMPDVWITHNNWRENADALKDVRYKPFFNVIKYNNNKKLNKAGFNDYWEEGMSRPDLLLKDLASVIHQDKFAGNDLIWYRKLE